MTERWWRNSLILAVAIAAGCSAQKRDQTWVDQLRAREAALVEPTAIGASDGSFGATVPARLSGSVEPGESADYAALDIGSETPVECALYHDEVESASSLQTFSNQIFDGLTERYGAAPEKKVSVLDAGVIGASPFLQLHWRYRIARDEGEVVGELKQMIASREGRSIYCVHHENGYTRSFERVFRDLVGSLRFSAYDELRPYFTQVDVLSSNGENFGFSSTTATLEEDGEPRIVRYTASLGRDDTGTLSARDVTEVEHSTVNGVLRNKIYNDFHNGEVATSLILEEVDDAGWRVRGVRGGDTLQAVLEPDRLESWIGETREFRVLTLDPVQVGRVTESQVWQPEIEVGESVLRRAELLQVLDNDRFAASVDLGSEHGEAVIDRDGLTYQTTRGEVLSRRVFAEGALH